MLAYLIRRLLLAGPLLLAVLFVSFSLLYALPGDPTHALLGVHWTPEAAQRIREAQGLDDPMVVQFGRYVYEVFVEGDLGTNQQQKPVADELVVRIPATMELAMAAMIVAVVAGVLAGVFSALKPRGWRDMFILSGALAGVSLPIFWLALMAQRLFRRGGMVWDAMGWSEIGLPLGGRLSETMAAKIEALHLRAEVVEGEPLTTTGFYLIDSLAVYHDPAMFADAMLHLLLPALVLSTVPAAIVTRITRTAVIEQLSQDYTRTARAKGLGTSAVVRRHVLRNAAIPIVTSIGTQCGYLLGGAVLTETIFNWPGMGTYVVDAILKEDVRPLQAAVLVIAIGFIAINLLVDISYAVLDPRVRIGAEEAA